MPHFQSEWDILEVTCYQIVVVAHLYGPGHVWVLSKLVFLAMKCQDLRSKDGVLGSDYLQAVKWLYTMGLSAPGALEVMRRSLFSGVAP